LKNIILANTSMLASRGWHTLWLAIIIVYYARRQQNIT